MTDFLDKVITFAGDHWLWLSGGAALVVLLWLATVLGRVRAEPARSRLMAPVNWYAGHRGARRLTVNVVGVALIIWFAQTFSLWVQPALTPDMLFTPPVVGPQGVYVAMVEEGLLEDRVTYTGTVLPYEDAMVYARVDGYVRDLKVYPGDHVTKGQVLVTLETSELDPRMDHARADVAFWKAELERDQELFEAGAISASQFDRTRQQYQVAEAKHKLIQTQRDYATVRALTDGWISERKIYPGVYVKKGEALLKIDQLDRVRIQCEVAAKDLLHIRAGTLAYLRFPHTDPEVIRRAFSKRIANPNGEGTEQHDTPRVRAEVAVVFPAQDPKTRTGTVEIRLPNPGLILKTNTYVVGELVRARAEKALRVPASALNSLPDGKTVLFVGPAFAEEGPAEMREVKIGLRTRGFVQILEGVQLGEFVVTKGNRSLTDGQTIRVVRREGGV